MTSKTTGMIGFLFLIAAAIVAVLNLRRVADLGMIWLSPILLIIGLGLVAASRRRR